MSGEFSGPAGIEEACRRAAAAFDPYRRTPDATRAAFLRATADRLRAAGEELVAAVRAETALTEARARTELDRTVNQLRMFADLLDDPAWASPKRLPALPDRRPAPRPDLRSRSVPIGPVAVFGASNFPLAFSTAGGDTASALAAGCPVVVKSHPAHPRTARLAAGCVLAAAAETGLPEGVFGLVVGEGNEPGERLVADPRIAAVAFTGSRAGGTALTTIANARPVPIPVYAEMSSVNPVFLLPSRLAAGTAEVAAGYVASLTASAGQFCTNPGLLLAVEGPHLDRFRAAVAGLVEKQPAQRMLHAGIAQAYRLGVAELTDLPAVTTLAVGTDPHGVPDACVPVVFQTDAATFHATPRLRDEVFGASGLLVACPAEDDLVELAQELPGQLTATLQAAPGDRDLARRLLPLLERRAGRIIYNGWPTGVEVAGPMVHGGPYPATADGRSTSVGPMAIDRFLRPVCYQGFPDDLAPC
ncbi:aldehyde dehydrogenase (NADP(+)) [Phytohabitans sp. ZYX-F-186]|uniref:Aldehyde dehydrogenase (NADP(+)) n=1 Tax=Phytohabitans maris TaxID=3071409 RepID=A0ABU0ZW90_9ACTN|nr:aldehyde dehydrogenase (NADP(+)) [Phytohabitans sp. ZYX-F-186]MDQ7911298.1 aldehyde dehydrogenase (NADP(+)) [Phytohabitans sp. ZYX-F-186]